jgi:hypothetical protein
MIGVQVGAHDEIDLLGRNALLGKALEPRRLEPVEHRRLWSFLVITAAGIDQNDMMRRPHKPALQGHDDLGGHSVYRAIRQLVPYCGQILTGDRIQENFRRNAHTLDFGYAVNLQVTQ